ncbi:MAG TPA: methyltransferase domain-containing protein [Acidiphilium sp.]|nr:methyltransferase domain-containing protein [Acidiphilium sp.]HQU25187.1 methyltransferase domain-containing protein [Acidiphilium sp.]
MLEKLRREINTKAASNSNVKTIVSGVARAIGYDLRHLIRVIYQDECLRWINELRPQSLDVLEISAGAAWRDIPFKSFTEMNYPDYDICKDKLDRQFDLVIADQVFEHLLWPYRAGRNVFDMVKPGGYFMVMTPFMIRIHDVPVDCSRWTETGMRYFLAECVFELETIKTGAWGNRDSLKANLVTWARVGWRKSFPNELAYPQSIWAMARKPLALGDGH